MYLHFYLIWHILNPWRNISRIRQIFWFVFFLRQEKCFWDFPTFITNNRGQILNSFFSHVSFGFVIGYGLQQSGVFCFHLATFSIFLLQHLFDIGVLSFKGSLVSESFFYFGFILQKMSIFFQRIFGKFKFGGFYLHTDWFLTAYTEAVLVFVLDLTS